MVDWLLLCPHVYVQHCELGLNDDFGTLDFIVFCLKSAVKGGVVNRMTDTKKYTGTHKERFDESGKGKGLAGREEVDGKEGYVQGYKERGTYDEKVKK